MISSVLPTDGELRSGSRLRTSPFGAVPIDAIEITLLALMGVTAALLAAFLDLRLRIPGHAIFRTVVPMSFGLAAAPRRRAGALMALTAVLAAIGLNLSGAATVGAGALVSLGLTGVLLDMAAARAPRGRMLYVAFAAAGLGSNLAAFAVRGAAKYAGVEPGARPFAEWISVAPVSYAACGLLAGLTGAALFFHFGVTTELTRPEERGA